MDAKKTSEEEKGIAHADIKQKPVDLEPSDGSTDTMDKSITKIEEVTLVMKEVPTAPEIKLLNVKDDNNPEHTIKSNIKQEPRADLELMKRDGSGEKTLQRLPAYTHSDIKQEPMDNDQTYNVTIELIPEGSEQNEMEDIKYANTQDFLDISETVISKQDRAISEQDRAIPGPSSKDVADYRLKNISFKNKKTAERKVFECDICDYQTSQRRYLKQHMRTHTEEKPYKCEICEYKSAYNASLKQHIRTHTGEKPYECEMCDYKTVNQRCLKRHIKTHTGEKPHKCEICHYKSIDKRCLNRHIKTHTGEKPHKCGICDYKCINRYDLRRHMRRHTDEKPYKCEICGYKCGDQCYKKRRI